jgi:hypothetical protein
MCKAYVVADGDSVGLVCLAVHYEFGAMFVAHDVKLMLPSLGKRAWEACLSVVNDFLPATCQSHADGYRVRG